MLAIVPSLRTHELAAITKSSAARCALVNNSQVEYSRIFSSHSAEIPALSDVNEVCAGNAQSQTNWR